MNVFRKKVKCDVFEDNCKKVFKDAIIENAEGISIRLGRIVSYDDLEKLNMKNIEISVAKSRIFLSDKSEPSEEYVMGRLACKNDNRVINKNPLWDNYLSNSTFELKQENIAWAFKCLKMSPHKLPFFNKIKKKTYLIISVELLWWEDLLDIKKEKIFGEIFLKINKDLIDVYLEFCE